VFLGILAVAIVGGVLTARSDAFVIVDGTVFRTGAADTVFVIGLFLLVVGGWVTTLSLHEFGHAFVAFRGGDYSVQHKGYLNLDVRKYTDPVLSIVLPLVFLAIGGIPLPGGAVWINRGALRSRATSTWVSLAGPLSNLGVGVVLALVLELVPGIPVGLVIGLSYLAILQMVTFILNILPVPGLDGYGAIEPYLSPDARAFGAKARPWAPLILFAALFALPGASNLLWEGAGNLFTALGGNTDAAFAGQSLFQFWRH
jgi:Zn-dependent protease